VENILVKLGLANRTQVARWIVARGTPARSPPGDGE
jgi:DNA-binding NarL/FixJ family response regulator